jgi:hypothetical protein
MTKTPAATATYNDIWAGAVEAILLPFKTKRNGQTVVRYRWEEKVRGFEAGGWRSGFVSIDQAISNARRHRAFSNIQPA